MSDESQRQQSEYNDSFGYLNRMNFWLFHAGLARNSLNAHGWIHCLGNFFAELSTEMKKEEEEAANKTFFHLTALLINYQDNAFPQSFYLQIHLFELELRRIFKVTGLQHKTKEDSSFAIK
jgi:hypothetical protein